MVKTVMTFMDVRKNVEKSVTDVIKENLDKKIFYFGELHERNDVLQAQMASLKVLSEHGPLILGLEMFNVLQQALIDDYLQGIIDKDVLEREYQKGPEGFSLRHYGQLLDLAKQLGVSVKGLIIPRNMASLVVRKGLDALKEHQEVFSLEQDYIPGTKEHEDHFLSLIKDAAPMMKAGFSHQRFFQAQVVKDSVMARSVVRALKDTRWESRILIITGSGHVDYRFGVPERVQKMLANEGVELEDVLITTQNQDQKLLKEKHGRIIADYLFYSKDD